MPLLGECERAIAGPFIRTPNRFGVVDVIPQSQSAENDENSEPSLAMGKGANYGRFAVHAFKLEIHFDPSTYSGAPLFTSDWDGAGSSWNQSAGFVDGDATLDWSAAGTFYISTLGDQVLGSDPSTFAIAAFSSPDPATSPFSFIAQSQIGRPETNPDQPWLRTVNVNNVDHIFVGLNNESGPGGQTASIRYSLDGGANWTTTVIEPLSNYGGYDTPVRLAISSDGKTVYGFFERYSSSSGLWSMVLVRDDAWGWGGFTGLPGGTIVADSFEQALVLGHERLGTAFDVAINPLHPEQVFVAYTEQVGGVPTVQFRTSADSGRTFGSPYMISSSASLPALAVTQDGTVGLLYAALAGMNWEVRFRKAYGGNFSTTSPPERLLAKSPDGNPSGGSQHGPVSG